MKNKAKFFGAILVIILCAFTGNSNAGRCEDGCVPYEGRYCSYGTGIPDDPVDICGPGWGNMNKLTPISPFIY